MPDVVLTGLPRSGSTLTCFLLNRCADTVALHEPLPIPQLAREHGREAVLDHILDFYAETRHSLLTERRAFSKAVDGQVPDNPFPAGAAENGELRQSRVKRAEIRFDDKELSPDFTLAVKQNAGFTVLLERLVTRLPCFGIIRHPLATLASWNSVDIPVQGGRLLAAERIDPTIGAALDRIEDRLERQLYILEWFFERFARLLPRERILRYEDTIASGGRTLRVVTPHAEELGEPLKSKNFNAAYDRDTMRELGRRLRGRAGTFWEFYSRESVEEMLVEAGEGRG